MKNKSILNCFKNLGKVGRTALFLLGGVLGVSTIVTATSLTTSCSSSNIKRNVKVNSTEVNFSSSFESDGTLKAFVIPIASTKYVESISIKIGEYTLNESEYTFNKESGDILISKKVLDAHTGDIVITPTLKDKKKLVETITITNKDKDIFVGDKVELTADVTPVDAENKNIKYSIIKGSECGELVEENNKTYLKGKGGGSVTIDAAALDESGIKSIPVEFLVTEKGYSIDWNKTSFNFDDCGTSTGENCTLYEAAMKSSRIIFMHKSESEVGSLCVGETNNDKIYASLDGYKDYYELKIWSSKEIVFSDNDLTYDENYKIYYGFFYNCTHLISITLDNVDVSDVTNFDYMFTSCPVVNLDLSSFNTKNLKSMYAMFSACDKLRSIKFGNKFNTSNVENMSFVFGRCSELLFLDLTSFDTKNVKDMTYMFYGASKLKTIYVDKDKFITAKYDGTKSMFSRCTSLVGKQGTICNDDDSTYGYNRAHVDGGEQDPGYFTNVTDNPTYNDFVLKFNEFVSNFNDSIDLYDDSEIKHLKWDNESSFKTLSSLNYDTFESKRGCTFSSQLSGESSVRFDINNYIDKIESFSEIPANYIVTDEFIEFERKEGIADEGISLLRVNKYGYVEEVIEKGENAHSFLLHYFVNPAIEPIKHTLDQERSGYNYKEITLEPGKRYKFIVENKNVKYFFIKGSDGMNINLSSYIVATGTSLKSPKAYNKGYFEIGINYAIYFQGQQFLDFQGTYNKGVGGDGLDAVFEIYTLDSISNINVKVCSSKTVVQ